MHWHSYSLFTSSTLPGMAVACKLDHGFYLHLSQTERQQLIVIGNRFTNY